MYRVFELVFAEIYKFLNINFECSKNHHFNNLVVNHIGKLYLMKLGELGK
ncbi:Uncharacterised protein [Legionella pneumophila]|nr:Uncharacterised protein [Legionella pneumophila]